MSEGKLGPSVASEAQAPGPRSGGFDVNRSMCFLVFHVYDLNSSRPQQVFLNVAIYLKCNHKSVSVKPACPRRFNRCRTWKNRTHESTWQLRECSLLARFKPFAVRLRTRHQWNIFKRHERVALLSHPCNNAEESRLAADSAVSAWRLFSCVLLPCALSPGMKDPKLAFNQIWTVGQPAWNQSLPRGPADVKGWGQRRADGSWPQSPVFLLELAHIKGGSNHCRDLANDVLIKRHISKRQLKRPEGEEAIRAHLYVDERESVDRPCIRIQSGSSLASAAKFALQERASEAVSEWEREGARWWWDVVGGQGGRKNSSLHHSSFFVLHSSQKE